MGLTARERVRRLFDAERNFDRLMEVFSGGDASVIGSKPREALAR
jgi:hypothetical protein